MQVSELMLRDPTLIPAEDTVQNAARAMADIDSRFILVGADDRVAGVLTIGDILIRLVAAGLDAGTDAGVAGDVLLPLHMQRGRQPLRPSWSGWPNTASSRCRCSVRADALLAS